MLRDFSAVISWSEKRTVAIMQKTDASSTSASAVRTARTRLRRKFLKDSSSSFSSMMLVIRPRAWSDYVTLENTSDTFTPRACQAGTMPPRKAVAAPWAGPHQNPCTGTKKIGKKANGILMPPAT